MFSSSPSDRAANATRDRSPRPPDLARRVLALRFSQPILLSRAKEHGQAQFAEVKPQSRRRIQISIDVVYGVESPEERDPVVTPMPEPKGVIEQENGDGNPNPAPGAESVEQPEPPLHDPTRDRNQNRDLQELRGPETCTRDDEISTYASQPRLSPLPQRAQGFQPKEKEKR